MFADKKSEPKMKIGWALMRVSTKTQAEVQHGSLEQQRHMLERWSAQQSDASGQRYEITRFFEKDIYPTKRGFFISITLPAQYPKITKGADSDGADPFCYSE